MEQYISKSAVIAEIERLRKIQPTDEFQPKEQNKIDWLAGKEFAIITLQVFLDTLEVKEVAEYKQPEYSCFETVYQCGKKPHWNIDDTLAYYEFYSDREGESVLGKVTKADFDKEQCDWFYTFENGSVYDEQSLLEEKTYKKN